MTFHDPLQSGKDFDAQIERRIEHARACGALQPIQTAEAPLEDQGLTFVVRIVSSLVRKAAQQTTIRRPTQGTPPNPFLPYDKNLEVAEISKTHVCLLNKFNVIKRHLLIVTRHFEPQEMLLTLQDFRALYACLDEFDGLAFYNGGAAAGASQSHKHLQIVPRPLVAPGNTPTVESILEQPPSASRSTRLPFPHAHSSLDSSNSIDPAQNAWRCYLTLLEAAGLPAVSRDGQLYQSNAYNLLVTRRWMLVVPRKCECFERVSINALGFAGSLFVRSREEYEMIQARGPLTVLQAVAGPQ